MCVKCVQNNEDEHKLGTVFHNRNSILGLYDFGKAFLCTLCSLVPFLERELVDTLPYVVASTLTSFSASLVDEVLDVLCWQLLPFTGT